MTSEERTPADLETAIGPSWVRQSAWMTRRKYPLAISVLYVASGLLFMFFWDTLVHHGGGWVTGGDLWGIYRGAHYVGWGDFGGIYANGNGIVSFPGMALLLAPVAMVAGHFHLTESFPPFFLSRPSAALVVQPIELLISVSVIFASDALGQELRISSRRRIAMCIAVAVVAWPVVALWGHAEDVLAVTFALYAMIAMGRQKWAAMGWLFALGIVMQPLVALMLPLFIGATPRGQRLFLAIRSASVSAVVVGLAFLSDFADTYRALVKQPTPPSVNHATPWAYIAPKLNVPRLQTIHGASLIGGLGHPAAKAVTITAKQVVEVAGGPGRMIDVVFALLVGIYVWRRPQPTVRVLWLAAIILASRCFFEPVMTPYYLAPPLILCLVMVARQRAKRFWTAAVIALEITVFAYHHLNPWVWWLPVVAGLGVILALAYPGAHAPDRKGPELVDEDHQLMDQVGKSIGATAFQEIQLQREPALH